MRSRVREPSEILIRQVREARPVDPATYLDGYGREKQFTPAEMAGDRRAGALSWVRIGPGL